MIIIDETIANEIKARGIRSKRNQLLAATDWTQVQDAPTGRQVWANYRQALRDVPQQDGFPDDVEWPVPPNE